MKNIFSFFLLLMVGLFYAQVKKDLIIHPDAKVGLSLSGGGAKGFAHIGTLKVLDSLGVKVDYISGTSMGAIVGGLYAAGFTGKEIEKIVLDTDFYAVLANEKNRQESSFFTKKTDKYLLDIPIKNGKINLVPKSISKGQKNIYMLKELFKNVAHIDDFSQLPIPFICTGTNLESGKLKIFDKGDLVKSIMASSAYPSLIDPVKIGDSLYIDGAMTINYPSELLKDKNMDIVIGVDLSQGLSKRENLTSAFGILDQVIDFNIQKETQRQYQFTDINIHPNLEGLGATSYGDKKKILDLGYQEALKYVDVLSQLPKRENQLLRAPSNPIFSNVYKIDEITVENNNIFDVNYVQGKMRLKVPSLQTYGSINKMIDKLYATNNYNLISYDLIRENNKTKLNIIVNEEESRYYLKFGLHYDEVMKTGLLLNATIKRLLFKNSTVSLDVVVGDKPRYYFNYSMDNGYIPGIGVFASGMRLDLKNEQEYIHESWNWFRNEAFIQSIWRDKYAIGGGISHDYFSSNSVHPTNATENFINPFIFAKSDTQDDKNFPTRGFFIDTEVKVLDLYNKEIQKKAIQAKVNMHINFPISQAFTYRLNLYGGISIGDYIPYYYQFRPGGIFEQPLGNFIKFKGYHFGDLSANNILIASNDLQLNFKKNYYLVGHLNFANLFNDTQTDDILKISNSSAGITAGYKSPFGQIKVNYSKALEGRKGIFSVILGHWF
ncbi:patatin-like phospholipase family protein [Bergeyella zoohelcum]|uniref:PNPLA domain-containing protein n=1 Tax=Bergeyella zoohelcum ATCC 43767 TaxID=883096 RepID=K1MTL0_9FLAO|nr:hypothetical protein HMPREF9699_00360 [Bergeyella zoohelcum ATCC 43767]SUV49464.1 NTE family protein rssA [Bergeyella zoohelcum]